MGKTTQYSFFMSYHAYVRLTPVRHFVYEILIEHTLITTNLIEHTLISRKNSICRMQEITNYIQSFSSYVAMHICGLSLKVQNKDCLSF